MKKTFLLLLISCLFAACSTDDDPNPEPEAFTKELKLSVQGIVNIENVDFEFEIIDGNGEYTASVSKEDDAKVEIVGNKVKVNLFRYSASVTIKDKEQQSASVYISSSDRSLTSTSYGIFMSTDSTSLMKDISFGVGGYTLKKIKGTSAEAVMTENDHVKITGIKPGTSYYKIIDKRGKTADLNISVVATYRLKSDNLEITAVSDQSSSIVLEWGAGDWTLVETPLNGILAAVYLHKKGDFAQKYDVLQIDTSKGDNIKGRTIIRLKDKAGNYASIIANVQQ